MEYYEFRAMNTTILLAAEGRRPSLKPGFAQAHRFVAEAEQRFSRFRETSELSYLNRSAGQWVEVSEAMFSLLQEATEVYHLTGGLFDPTILGALKSVGYDRTMDEIRRLGVVPVRPEARSLAAGFDRVELDAARRAVRLPHGVQIDLGGIAKGWIAGHAARQLAQFTAAGAVSAGGDMALFGLPQGESTWPVSLEDPQDPNRVIAVLKVGPGAVATSSVTKRRWNQQGQARHHIIDPRRGAPAASPWLSVTVHTEKATHAEALAKALLIAGPDHGPNLAEQAGNLQFVVIHADGRMFGNLETVELNSYVPESTH